jgi:hypothetical protein
MDAQKSEFDNLRTGLERKVRDAQTLNDSLQAEITRVRLEKSEMERNREFDSDLKSQLEDARRRNQTNEDEWRRRLDEARREARDSEDRLKQQLNEARSQQNQSRGGGGGFDDGIDWRQRYETLELQLQEQRQITDEVRREASRFLQEMRDLSQQSSESVEKEDQLQDQIRLLDQEVRMWKARYAKAKSSGGDLQSPGLSSTRGNVGDYVRDAEFVSSNGVIKDMNVTNFQLAIDDLLQQARNGNEKMLNDSIKMVVMAVRLIAIDMEDDEARNGTDPSRPSKLRMRLSQAANNLITATKSYTESNGVSPVSLVDAAASYLSGAVVDIVKSLKIRRSTPEELAEDQVPPADYMYSARPAPLNTKTKGSISGSSINSGIMRNASSSSAAYSTYRYSGGYSQNTSPQGMNSDMTPYVVGQVMGLLREESVVELKNYVEDINMSLTRSIQPLVNTIRSQPAILADDPIVATYVDDISASVFELVARTNSTIQELDNATLANQAPPVIDLLVSTARELVTAKERGDISGLPQLVFKISRTTKALMSRLQKIETGELTKESPSTLDVL